MTMLNWSTFVLQRRVNQRFGAVGRVVCDPWLLPGGTQIALADDAVLRLEEPFGVAFPVFGLVGASWATRASIRSPRGRVLERVEVELSIWDDHATELLLRRCPDAQIWLEQVGQPTAYRIGLRPDVGHTG